MSSTTSEPKRSKPNPQDHGVLVAVIGYTGGVGTCLLSAMDRINLQPYALARSSTMTLDVANNSSSDPIPVDYDLLATSLKEAAHKASLTPVIADVTASDAVQQHYVSWLSQGISIATANKGIFAGAESKYQALLSAAKADPSCHLLHETTVGAGLPVLGTLTSLQASSHTIIKVEGILSGTLAYVLGAVSGGKETLSNAVVKAKELGYTEPDPRMDLNGLDVARKAVILARLSQLTGVELEKLNVESLVPKALEDCSVEEFLEKLGQYDEEFAQRVAKVEATPGQRLHYAASIDVANKQVTVGPMAFESSHPFNSAGPDNLVAITTDFYTRPLVVQGAGAGGDVTATGVLADILQCA
jgi:homoserine dehydrogenase